MKLTLAITGSASALAHILTNLPADAEIDGPASMPMPSPGPAPVMPSAGAPVPMPVPPMPAGDSGEGDDGDDGAPADANAPAVDGAGLPWDERIHSSSKKIGNDGTWNKRRGGPKGAELAAIEAELRARGAAPAAAPQPVPAPMPIPASAVLPMPVAAPPMPEAIPAPQPVPAPMPIPAPQPVPMPMAAPVPQPAPAPAAAPIQAAVDAATAPLDFAAFMQHLSGQMTKRDAAGQPLIHTEYLAGITAEISAAFGPHGVPPLNAITDINGNPQLIAYAQSLLARDGRW